MKKLTEAQIAAVARYVEASKAVRSDAWRKKPREARVGDMEAHRMSAKACSGRAALLWMVSGYIIPAIKWGIQIVGLLLLARGPFTVRLCCGYLMIACGSGLLLAFAQRAAEAHAERHFNQSVDHDLLADEMQRALDEVPAEPAAKEALRPTAAAYREAPVRVVDDAPRPVPTPSPRGIALDRGGGIVHSTEDGFVGTDPVRPKREGQR